MNSNILTIYETEKITISILCENDADELKKMVSSEGLIKDVGRGLSEQSIKLFTSQKEKQVNLLESIKNKQLNLYNGFIVLGVRLNQNNKFICVMHIVDSADGSIIQGIVCDPNHYDLLDDIYDAYHTLIFEVLNCKYVKCSCLKTTLCERTFIRKFGYSRCAEDKSENYYTYEMTLKQYLENKELNI